MQVPFGLQTPVQQSVFAVHVAPLWLQHTPFEQMPGKQHSLESTHATAAGVQAHAPFVPHTPEQHCAPVVHWTLSVRQHVFDGEQRS